MTQVRSLLTFSENKRTTSGHGECERRRCGGTPIIVRFVPGQWVPFWIFLPFVMVIAFCDTLTRVTASIYCPQRTCVAIHMNNTVCSIRYLWDTLAVYLRRVVISIFSLFGDSLMKNEEGMIYSSAGQYVRKVEQILFTIRAIAKSTAKWQQEFRELCTQLHQSPPKWRAEKMLMIWDVGSRLSSVFQLFTLFSSDVIALVGLRAARAIGGCRPVQ